MSKNKEINLEDLTKEELIKKCLNQRENIKQLQESLKYAKSQIAIYELAISSKKYDKNTIYMQETLSYIKEVERLKKELEKRNEF